MARPRILVIDDDPLFRSLLTSMLRKDFVVTVAADGSEGYYKALEIPPDLAIVDVQMPGWDGLRTLRAFRTHHLLAGVPVMIMTSDASRTTVVAAVEGGAADYVIKTALSRDEFLEKVYRLVQVEAKPVDPEALPHDPPNGSSRAREALLAFPREETSPATTIAPVSPRVGPQLSLGTGPQLSMGPQLSEDALLQSILDNWE